MKATEMAISNPLIDDYTLKGAKGLISKYYWWKRS
jgi:cell division GTPase FtsZ